MSAVDILCKQEGLEWGTQDVGLCQVGTPLHSGALGPPSAWLWPGGGPTLHVRLVGRGRGRA